LEAIRERESVLMREAIRKALATLDAAERPAN
jgi:hypothetical protein